MADDDLYPCIGVCQNDPETGICIGCGRPPEIPLPPPPAADQDGGDGVQVDPEASKNR